MNRFIVPLYLLCLIPLPAYAQDAGTSPGLRSFEISDDEIETLYKLKSGARSENTPEDEPSDTMADQPLKDPGQKPQTETTKSPSTNLPAPQSSPGITDPNTQSRSLTFIPDDAEKAIKAQKLTETQPQNNQKIDPTNKSADTPNTSGQPISEKSSLDEKIFTPAAKLKPWDKRDTLYGLGQNSEKIRAALIVFSSEPEYANPQTLMDVAALYAQVGDYKSAARYYYAANLRRAFDVARFPASNIPPLDGGTWGESVGAWVAGSSTRMQNTLNDLRAWDERIPYRYHPGYKVPERSINRPVLSESEWMDLLVKTRTDFFKSVGEMSQALGRMGK